MKLRIVPARQGAQWVRLGLKTFMRQPMAMAGQFFMFVAAVSLLSLVPILGPVLAIALMPAATVGLMSASREAHAGRFPMPHQLISALRSGTAVRRNILMLGFLYAAAFAVVLSATMLADGGTFLHVYLGRAQLTAELATDGGFLLASILFVALYLPLNMMFWHAPGLVAWHGVAPVKSLFFSMVACLRNFWAFSIYSFLWAGVIMGSCMVVGIVAMLMGVASAIPALLYPLAMVLAGMFFTSIYFTFESNFDFGPANSA